MKAKLSVLVPLVVVGIAVVLLSYTRASSDTDKAEIMALNQRVLAAYNKRDVSAAMACYSDDSNAIFFEDTIPFQVNKAGLRKGNEIFFQSVSTFHVRMEAVEVLVSGNLAVVRYTAPSTWTDKSGGTHSQTSRYTQVDRKEGGNWFIWDEHLSVPYDPATGKAVLNAKS